MNSDWRETTIGDEATLQRGFDITRKAQRAGDVPVVSSGGISSWHDTHKVERPGVVLGRKGTVGSVYWIDQDYWPHDTTLWVKDFHGNHPRFVYYFFLSMAKTIAGMDVGAANPTLNRNHVHPLEVQWPPFESQVRIADILGTLDDKIELNRRMNQTLEGMAQAIFKSWFVDFDPVKAKAAAAAAGRSPVEIEGAAMAAISGKPESELDKLPEAQRQSLARTAALFPAGFEPSPLGEIPEGWEVVGFDALATLDTTSVKPFEAPAKMWEHYSIPAFDASGFPVFENGKAIKSNKYAVKPGAVLSSKLNPQFPRTWWPFILDPDAAICSTEFMQFVPKNGNEQSFIYSLITSPPFQSGIRARVTGSTGSRQRAQPKQIAAMEVICCGPALRTAYSTLARPLFEKGLNNHMETRTLAGLRDTLLPKLLSGEITVSDLEPQIEEGTLK